jgi:octaprenyl-diphosphate synthase
MTLQIDAALTALSSGARSRGADPLAERRIADVQAFLQGDLRMVESILSQAVSEGPEPGPAAARHLVERGGKRVRPMALLLAGRCFGGEGPVFQEMAAVVELVHSATLLHDDVIDEGMERRGVVTSRRRFGNGVSVLAGDLLLVGALDRTRRANPALLGDLIGTLRRLVDGEIIQLRGRTELDASEATYFRVLEDKTASLFSFATRAGALLAGAPEAAQAALSQYGELLGIAFQLVDDVIDYSGEATGKQLFTDLAEGKLTLPLVLTMGKRPELKSLVARIHAGEAAPCAEVARAVVESGACEVVRERAHATTAQAIRVLDVLPNSPARALLSVVAAELTSRLR